MDKKVLAAVGEMMNKAMLAEGNFVFSPVALYLALISLAEITGGNTRQQIVGMLGVSEPELTDVYRELEDAVSSTTQMTTSSISSSLWINDKMDYNEDFLLLLNKKINLASHAGAMGTAEMDRMITDWVNKTTGNLLKDAVEIRTTRNTLLELLTTIYFTSGWGYDFDKEDTVSGNFFTADGNEVKCKFMNQWVRTTYHVGDKFTAVTKALKDGYDTIFVLPDEGVNFEEIMADEQWSQLALTGRLATTKQMRVQLSMPKYDISAKFDLKNLLQSFGMEDVFDPAAADFTPISNMAEVYLSKAEQTTRFKVDEEGIEAASCVEFGVFAAGVRPSLEEVKFVLDRPFVFMVVSRDTVPVFAGKVMNPQKES
jgi:serpin B